MHVNVECPSSVTILVGCKELWDSRSVSRQTIQLAASREAINSATPVVAGNDRVIMNRRVHIAHGHRNRIYRVEIRLEPIISARPLRFFGHVVSRRRNIVDRLRKGPSNNGNNEYSSPAETNWNSISRLGESVGSKSQRTIAYSR